MENKSDSETVKEALETLRSAFPNAKIQLRGAAVTRWGKDEYSLGSYPSHHVGSKPEYCQVLKSPIDDQLWFIGDHCCSEELGTAHSAFKSGQEAAIEIVRQLHPLT